MIASKEAGRACRWDILPRGIGPMPSMRFLPFFQLNVLLVFNLTATLAGGFWIWAGLSATVAMQIVVNEIAGDDTDPFEASSIWALDASLFAILPLVCIDTVAFIAVASPTPSL